MTPNKQAQRLFRALKNVGYSKKYINHMLPSWWSDELLNDPLANVELSLTLSRMFGLKLRDLLQDMPAVEFEMPKGAKYKRSKKIDPCDLDGATALVYSVAKMVAAATPTHITSIPNDPFQLRKDIISRLAKRVSLMSVVGFLWECGIPTIHLADMPGDLKKMDGLCLKIGSRPVVILGKQSRYQAWQLFIVAHELAHISLGHVEENEVLVDYSVGEESYLLADDDPEESEADRFALALLNGEYDIHYTSSNPANAAQLADAAIEFQSKRQVDAGHIILNYGHFNNAWAVAQAALARIDKENAPTKINTFLFEHIDLSLIPNSSAEFLLKISGMAPSPASIANVQL